MLNAPEKGCSSFFFILPLNRKNLRVLSLKEEELVFLLKKKDKKGMEYLYDHYSSTLFGVIIRILKSQELSEEVLQDCFLKIWERIEKYDAEKGTLFTWMLNLVRNQSLDKLRSREFKKGARTRTIENTKQTPSYEAIVPENIGVQEILDNLPKEQRKLIDLMYFQGYSQSEIAEEFDIPLGTVKTRIRAVMNKLRELF